MNFKKDELLKRAENKEERVLLASLLDKYIKYQKSGQPSATNFLNIRELKLLTDVLKYLKADFHEYAPNEFCEKKIIYFGDYENYITTFKFEADVEHKDMLGFLFNNGFDTNTIGNIFIDNGYVYLTNLTKLNPLLSQELQMLKRNKIKLEIVNEINSSKPQCQEINIITPSYRLD